MSSHFTSPWQHIDSTLVYRRNNAKFYHQVARVLWCLPQGTWSRHLFYSSTGKCCIVRGGKSQVIPLHSIECTILRKELIAVTTAVSYAIKARTALGRPVNQIYMWTDSTTVLTWIESTHLKLKSFVKRRVERIKRLREYFPWVTWKYCPTLENTADVTSHGIKSNGKHANQLKLWLEGPSFLPDVRKWSDRPNDINLVQINENADTSPKKQTLHDCIFSCSSLNELVTRVSIYQLYVHFLEICFQLKVYPHQPSWTK